jgi:multiple sugar transport system substrate-binding protein
MPETTPPPAARRGQRRTRRTVLATTATTAAGLLAACGLPGSPAGDAAPSVQQPVTLELWDREQESYRQFMDTWLPTFAAKQPQIKLSFLPRPPQWQEKLTAAIVGGTPPDLVAGIGGVFRIFQEQKMALPLDRYVQVAKLDTQDFVAPVFRAMKWGGQQIAIPQYVSVNVVYYNREYLRQANLPIPGEDWTHAQLLDYAQKLTRGSGQVREVWGLDMVWTSFNAVMCLVWGQCGQINDPQNIDIFTFTKPENVRAFQWAHDLVWRYRVGPVSNADRGGVDRRVAMFSTGVNAMCLDGHAAISTWKNTAQTDWDLAPLPKGPCGRGEWASADGYLIPAGVKAPDASWVVTQAITDKEANKLRGEIADLIPARKSQFEAWAKTLPDKNLKAIAPTDSAIVSPGSLWPKSTEVGSALNPIMDKLFAKNELSVPDALTQMHQAVAGILGPTAVR